MCECAAAASQRSDDNNKDNNSHVIFSLWMLCPRCKFTTMGNMRILFKFLPLLGLGKIGRAMGIRVVLRVSCCALGTWRDKKTTFADRGKELKRSEVRTTYLHGNLIKSFTGMRDGQVSEDLVLIWFFRTTKFIFCRFSCSWLIIFGFFVYLEVGFLENWRKMFLAVVVSYGIKKFFFISAL